MPSAVKAGSNELGELACPVPDQELDCRRAVAEVHQAVAACRRADAGAPHLRFSVAMRITSLRNAASLGGRPGRASSRSPTWA
jgi:hypothetical protein